MDMGPNGSERWMGCAYVEGMRGVLSTCASTSMSSVMDDMGVTSRMRHYVYDAAFPCGWDIAFERAMTCDECMARLIECGVLDEGSKSIFVR